MDWTSIYEKHGIPVSDREAFSYFMDTGKAPVWLEEKLDTEQRYKKCCKDIFVQKILSMQLLSRILRKAVEPTERWDDEPNLSRLMDKYEVPVADRALLKTYVVTGDAPAEFVQRILLGNEYAAVVDEAFGFVVQDLQALGKAIGL